ncbi:MAG: lycopene cyclase domain-containing protein [Candidatus Dormibacteraeota bacterium]|nr:lycopene cyclase domain-containing protein [Candidatus Dormibacteraeota bacterium]
MRYAYLVALIGSWAGTLLLATRWRLGSGRRLIRALLITVPVFLAFDVFGSVRGWFASDRRLNSVIFPPGIPLEEPILLGFLTLLSVVIFRLLSRRLAPR